jgi:hypothetical protein
MNIPGVHMLGGQHKHKIADVKVIALYEPGTGRIVHTHTVTTVEGGRLVNEEEATATAKKFAAQIGHDTTKLAVATSADRLHAVRPHWIDPATGKFIPLPKREIKMRVSGGVR